MLAYCFAGIVARTPRAWIPKILHWVFMIPTATIQCKGAHGPSVHSDRDCEAPPIRVVLYTPKYSYPCSLLITSNASIHLSTRARRMSPLGLWRAMHVWKGADMNNTRPDDLLFREGAKYQLTEALGSRPVKFAEASLGTLASTLADSPSANLIVVAGAGSASCDPDSQPASHLTNDLAALEATTCPIVALSVGTTCAGEGDHDDPPAPFPTSSSASHAALRRLIARASLASVRDHSTQSALLRAGLRELPIVVNPAFLLAAPWMPDELPGIDDTSLLVGLNIGFHGERDANSRRQVLRLMARVLRQLAAETRCRFSYFAHSDSERMWASALSREGITFNIVDGDTEHLLANYSRMDIHICHGTHSAIMAMTASTPTFALAQDAECPNFFREFGLSDYCLDAARITDEMALQAIQRLISQQYQVRATIAARGEELRKGAMAFYSAIASLAMRQAVGRS